MKEEPKKDDFKQYNTSNPYILYSESQNSFKCKEHPDLHLVNKGSTVRHSKTAHDINLEGNPAVVDSTKTSESNESKSDLEIKNTDSDEIKNLKLRLKIKQGGEQSAFVPEMVLDNLNKDIADGATKIAKSIHLQFLYVETKHIFPADWTFEDFVAFHITYSLNQWGISYGVSQDTDALSEEQLEAVIKAKETWQKKLHG